MKALVRAALVLTVAVGMALPLAAQARARKRGLLVSKLAEKNTDGVEIKVVGASGAVVDPAQSFKAGDKLRVRFRGYFDGHIYLINVTPGGVTKALYGAEVRGDAEREQEVPVELEFDEEKGVEVLKVVMSRERIPLYEDAMRSAGGMLGNSAQSVAEELNGAAKKKKPAGGRVSENVGIVQPGEGKTARCRGLELGREGKCQELVLESGKAARARGLVLAPGDRAKNEGTVVAISDKQGTKLKAGEVAVFEIRLKHI
jgi:hypothetical protein